MIVPLLIVTFLFAAGVSFLVALLFAKPIDGILNRVIPGDMSRAWARYLRFAIIVFGIGGGVRLWDFEKYLMPMEPYKDLVPLTQDRWVLEIYQAIIGALQSTAGILLAFFVVALIAVVIVRFVEARTPRTEAR